LSKYTEGICGNGTVILKDGEPIRISEVLSKLNDTEQKETSLSICVFCKKCSKPFSVSRADYGIVDVDLVKENNRYGNKGYRVELVINFDGKWCDCK
jgi:hypothetical protein